jgi:GNAT superfamily N-acetyltransferase
MKIREMVESDYRAASSMLAQLYDEHVSLRPHYYGDAYLTVLETLFSESDLKVVAEDEHGDMVGFVRGELVDSGGNKFVVIHDIFIRSLFRGKGLGSLLMGYVYDKARLAGALSVRLQVDTRNPEAVSFWKKEGFEISHYKMDKAL